MGINSHFLLSTSLRRLHLLDTFPAIVAIVNIGQGYGYEHQVAEHLLAGEWAEVFAQIHPCFQCIQEPNLLCLNAVHRACIFNQGLISWCEFEGA